MKRNWGKEQAEKHMQENPGHAAIGDEEQWTCHCMAILPITETTPELLKAIDALKGER